MIGCFWLVSCCQFVCGWLLQKGREAAELLQEGSDWYDGGRDRRVRWDAGRGRAHPYDVRRQVRSNVTSRIL